MNIKIKRLNENAVIPKYAHEGDAGFDLVATEDIIVEPGQTVKVPTGIALQIPSGYECEIRPRSGITLQTRLRVQLGTIDAGYTGEIGVIVDNIAQPLMTAWYTHIDGYVVASENQGYLLTIDSDLEDIYYNGPDETTVPLKFGWYRPNKTYIIRKGDRIAQAVIKSVEHAKFTEVETLGETSRGEGGFGSTGVIAD